MVIGTLPGTPEEKTEKTQIQKHKPKSGPAPAPNHRFSKEVGQWFIGIPPRDPPEQGGGGGGGKNKNKKQS